MQNPLELISTSLKALSPSGKSAAVGNKTDQNETDATGGQFASLFTRALQGKQSNAQADNQVHSTPASVKQQPSQPNADQQTSPTNETEQMADAQPVAPQDETTAVPTQDTILPTAGKTTGIEPNQPPIQAVETTLTSASTIASKTTNTKPVSDSIETAVQSATEISPPTDVSEAKSEHAETKETASDKEATDLLALALPVAPQPLNPAMLEVATQALPIWQAPPAASIPTPPNPSSETAATTAITADTSGAASASLNTGLPQLALAPGLLNTPNFLKGKSFTLPTQNATPAPMADTPKSPTTVEVTTTPDAGQAGVAQLSNQPAPELTQPQLPNQPAPESTQTQLSEVAPKGIELPTQGTSTSGVSQENWKPTELGSSGIAANSLQNTESIATPTALPLPQPPSNEANGGDLTSPAFSTQAASSQALSSPALSSKEALATGMPTGRATGADKSSAKPNASIPSTDGFQKTLNSIQSNLNELKGQIEAGSSKESQPSENFNPGEETTAIETPTLNTSELLTASGLNGTSPANSSDGSLAPGEPPQFVASAQQPMEQVAEGTVYSVKNGHRELIIRLNPDNLGEVKVNLTSHGQQSLSARLIATTQESHDLLKGQLDSLKSTLSSQGVNVERLTVVLAGSAESNTAGNHSEQQPAPQQQQRENHQQGASQQFNQQNHSQASLFAQMNSNGQQSANFFQNQAQNRPGGSHYGTSDNSPAGQDGINATTGAQPARNDNGRISILA